MEKSKNFVSIFISSQILTFQVSAFVECREVKYCGVQNNKREKQEKRTIIYLVLLRCAFLRQTTNTIVKFFFLLLRQRQKKNRNGFVRFYFVHREYASIRYGWGGCINWIRTLFSLAHSISLSRVHQFLCEALFSGIFSIQMQDRMINSPKQAGNQPFFFLSTSNRCSIWLEFGFLWNANLCIEIRCLHIFRKRRNIIYVASFHRFYFIGSFLHHLRYDQSKFLHFFFFLILWQSDSHEQMIPGAMKVDTLIVFQAEQKKDRNIGILTMSLNSFDFYLSIQFD